MSLKCGILGLLDMQEMSGYDLMKIFSDSLANFWHVGTSQIYLELDNLHKKEMVEYKVELQEGKPNKKVYNITEKGREELIKWLESYDVKKVFNIKMEFLMVVFFSNKLPVEKNLNMLERFKKESIEKNKHMKEIQKHICSYEQNTDAHVYGRLTAKFGELFYKMSEEWAEYATEVIKKECKEVK